MMSRLQWKFAALMAAKHFMKEVDQRIRANDVFSSERDNGNIIVFGWELSNVLHKAEYIIPQSLQLRCEEVATYVGQDLASKWAEKHEAMLGAIDDADMASLHLKETR